MKLPFLPSHNPLSGYSTAEMIGANLSRTGLIGVVYEHFVENGVANCSVVFATANASEIVAAGASPPPAALPPMRRSVVPGDVQVQLGPPR